MQAKFFKDNLKDIKKEVTKEEEESIFFKNKQIVKKIIEKGKIQEVKEGIFDWKWAMKGINKNPHFILIAMYWKAKEFEFDNKLEAQGELKRLLRKSVEYFKKYSIKKFKDMLQWVEEDSRKKGSYMWTFDTLDKKLAEYNLDNKESNPSNPFN